jgi:hypothetical protein
MKGKSGKWTFDELNKFLANLRQYIPGTAMTYAGLKPEQRADLIDYLRTLADNPVPLPKAAEGACGSSQEIAVITISFMRPGNFVRFAFLAGSFG